MRCFLKAAGSALAPPGVAKAFSAVGPARTLHLADSLAGIPFRPTNFLIYRLGLWSIGWHRPCGCLGSLTGFL